MRNFFMLLVLVSAVCMSASAQNVTGTHQLLPGDAPNKYTIKTEIKGLQGVDIARITYLIDDKHTYVASPNNSFFSDRSNEHVKFYIMAVPATGVLNVELGIVLNGEGEFVFPVNFQYSRNEEKKSINLPQLNIFNQALVAEETENPNGENTEEPIETTDEPGLEEKIRAEEEARLAEEKAAQEAAAQKAEEEKAAQEAAARKAEEEKAAQEAAARKAEEEKAAQEEAAQKAEEEKAAQEAAAQKAEEEKAAQEEAAQKAEEEKAAQEAAARKAEEEKAAQEAAARKAEEEKVASNPSPNATGSYSVQILSLSKFSSTRLQQFCKEHGISMNEIVKRNVGEWTKISVGKVSSKSEAQAIQNRLRDENNINESFIVKLP